VGADGGPANGEPDPYDARRSRVEGIENAIETFCINLCCPHVAL
jgi:hypothetical protein